MDMIVTGFNMLAGGVVGGSALNSTMGVLTLKIHQLSLV
jgi:hypothetical protein